MDYFNGLTNEDLLAYFLLDLNCRKELTQYTYPHEFMESQDAIDEHVIRCQDILWNYLYETVTKVADESNIILRPNELESRVENKKRELLPVFALYIEKYIEEVKVTYIDLRG